MDDHPRIGAALLTDALARRESLLAELKHSGTDCVRLFHGVSEGRPGVAIDRYGPTLLVQSWRGDLQDSEVEAIADTLGDGLELIVWRRKQKQIQAAAGTEYIGTELGLRFDVTPPSQHRGLDPYLFLDFRAARRWVRAHSDGRRVLNLFSYTCGIGVAAAVGGASEVWNVDFAESALDIGRRNAALNGVSMGLHCENVLPVMRHIAGLPLGGRKGRRPAFTPLDAAPFDLVVLDPIRWAKTPWGAIDARNDYASLFKPAVLCLAPGGTLLATNHIARVDLDGWLEGLRRCARKAGRPLKAIDVLLPEADFPSFDGRPPLKMAICRV